ncbi:hypothetical protein LSCM1_06125 [Leishmania martiniquensis]|uniref:Uncharacterized protein n=1 Tax=Leishmania martiniquensis TaxID=1580590 RepID=A0A836HIU5_9TRYP|nr:hypothetical protein LSCM1_06125 [Leishmania martiniquensis]
MKQVNVETATREQLVDFIRRMHPQLQREQERVRELESQISGLQAFIHEKNTELRELRQQSDRLTEKSASDEETIRTLIKQLEGMSSERSTTPSPAPLTFPSVAQRSRTEGHGKGKSHPHADAPGIEHTPEALRALDVAGNGDLSRRPSRTSPSLKMNAESALGQVKSQNAAPTTASKTEELISAEKTIQELREVNAFYSAIVSQHDQEEKARMCQALACRSGDFSDEVASLRLEVERLQLHISTMSDQGEKLQRIIKTVEGEKAALMEENKALKRESVLLEAEMEEMTREYERARSSLVAAAAAAVRPSVSLERALESTEELPEIRIASTSRDSFTREPPPRAPAAAADTYSQQPDRRVSYPSPSPAPRVSPLARDGRQSMIGGVVSSASTAFSIAPTHSHSRFTFRSLRPMRVRNPDAHERELIDRIRLYEEQFAQMEAFETDRQRSFDEMERNRAELFVSMNRQIERQRKEIHRLRRLHEETSLKSSVTARPSRDHSFASLPNREEEEERSSLRRRGLRSPMERCLTAVPASSQSLHLVDSVDGVDTADDAVASWAHERDDALSRDEHQWQAASAVSPAPFGLLDELVWREEQERSHIRIEAVEEELELFFGMYASTVRLSAGALEARESQLLRETTDLMKAVDALQTRVVELEGQIGSAREAEKVVLVGEKEPEMTMVYTGDAGSPDTNVLHIGASLWEDKALHTALIALKAYGTVLEYHTEFVKDSGLNSTGAEKAMMSEEDCMGAEIARDLEEVRMMLDAARCPAQTRLPLPQAASPLLYEEPSAPKGVNGILTACQADTDVCEDEAKVLGAGSRNQTFSHLTPPQPFSPHTPMQAMLLSSHIESINREEGLARDMGGMVGQISTVSYVPPDNFSNERPTVRSPWSAFSSATNGAQEAKRDEDSGPVVGPSHNDTDQTAAVAIEAPSEGAVPLLLTTAGGNPDIPRFQDAPEEEHAHSSTSTSGDVDTSTAGSRRTPPEFEEERAASFTDGHSTCAKKMLIVEPQTISCSDVKTATESRQAKSPAAESADCDKEDAAPEKDEGSDGAEHANSATHNRETLSSTSHLEVTEEEEAVFLAQLKKEMAKGGPETAMDPIEDEHGMAASPGEVSIINGSGEEREAGCSEGQGARSNVTAADASAAISVPGLPCGNGGLQKSRHDGACQEKEAVTLDDLGDKLDEVAPPVEAPAVKHGKSGAAPSLPPNTEHGSEKRSPSSSSAASSSTSGDGVHFESGIARDQHEPQLPVPVAGPPPPPSLDTLFGGTVAVASSPSALHNSDRQLLPASPAPRPPPPSSDSSVSTHFAHLGTAIRSTTSPNSMLTPCPQESPSSPYFSWFPSSGQQLQPLGDSQRADSHGSSSADDFEAGFDPFA